MKVRIITRSKYIVEEVESIEEALAELEREIHPAPDSLVRLEHALIVGEEEIKA